ncbi:senescence regulator (Protein of unknown function, DUF584) [Thalictrum thalictroides]|uniref:Senescence regulator n=1 Tax=Thalictrum thalictroides TaxID=46969 RepID=A0A7J6V9W3_THATH|nr:senescence regulator (Protein of unknown function, DUF584) [Thalictrum thalictroides]
MMADRYSYYVNTRNDQDFDEEDVWAVLKDHNNPKMKILKDPFPVSTLRRLPAASRMIPRANKFSINNEAKLVQQQSVPVNIPDWSKVSRKNSHKGSWADDVNVDYNHLDNNNKKDDDDNEDEDDDDAWIPPHEWIAKKLARTQISSFSVCEGAGRTLKGRDLSKVRNAVLTRTGFLE